MAYKTYKANKTFKTDKTYNNCKTYMGPSINYVVSVGGEGPGVALIAI